MDSTLKVIEFVTPKNKYTIFYYKIPASFGSPHLHWAFNSGTREFSRLFEHQTNGGAPEVKCVIIVVVRRKTYNTVISLFLQLTQ